MRFQLPLPLSYLLGKHLLGKHLYTLFTNIIINIRYQDYSLILSQETYRQEIHFNCQLSSVKER